MWKMRATSLQALNTSILKAMPTMVSVQVSSAHTRQCVFPFPPGFDLHGLHYWGQVSASSCSGHTEARTGMSGSSMAGCMGTGR